MLAFVLNQGLTYVREDGRTTIRSQSILGNSVADEANLGMNRKDTLKPKDRKGWGAKKLKKKIAAGI
ncbi:hypothetical protein GQ600_11697 [Phytophthora cactorum]|nr:hypothetical protein GQ600_11697 [Phytophthora cactorum]